MAIDSRLTDLLHPLATVKALRDVAANSGPVAVHWSTSGPALVLCVTTPEDIRGLLAWAAARWPPGSLSIAREKT